MFNLESKIINNHMVERLYVNEWPSLSVSTIVVPDTAKVVVPL